MIPLFKPFMPELPELESIIHSGKLTRGEYTKLFEDSLKEYFGTPYILVTNTFGYAVSVAATALGLTFGDEIVASPMGCLVSTQPYLSSGFKIKWADIDPARGTLSPDSLRKTVTAKTKLIVHNHFCGYVGYIDEINAIGKEFGIPVIDDGIECFGSEYKGQKIGNCGTDVTVFALSAVRLPNTVEGGIIIFKNEELYKKALRIHDCGIDRSRFRDELGEISPLCDISEIGYSAAMSNVNAYMGLMQMPKIDALLARQRQNAKKWDAIFESRSDISPISADDTLPNYWVYGVRAEKKRESIIEFRDKGYYASGVHINNNIYSAFGEQIELPGVTDFNKHFLALPCGWWIGDNND